MNTFGLLGRWDRGDQNVIDEVIRGDTYRMWGQKFDTVVDVGAHIGTFSRLCRMISPGCYIVAVEPNRENYDLLVANAVADVPLCGAVYYNKSGAVFYEDAKNASGGFLGDAQDVNNESFVAHGTYAEHGYQPLRFSLEEVFEHVPSRRMVDVLKLDCERSELGILLNAKCLSRVKRVVLEWHQEKSHPFRDFVKQNLPDWSVHGVWNQTEDMLTGALARRVE